MTAENVNSGRIAGQPKSRITFRQASYLALSILAIYYPISIYVNVPAKYITTYAESLIIPAIINLIFYILLIIATDRIIDFAEKRSGRRLLTEIRFPTLLIAIPFAVMATFFSHFLFATFFEATRSLFTKEQVDKKPDISQEQLDTWERTNTGLTLVTVLSIIYLLLIRKSNFRMKDMEIVEEQLKKENALAQYEALKNQISPHFLFNSLSILSSLVHIDPNLSENFIDQLSKAYRYILEQKDNDSISLRTELNFIKSYAFLLKIRFENKFDMQVAISEEEHFNYKIAPLTLQLLVENCVKHNRMSNKEPLRVHIFIKDHYLHVENAIKVRNENELMVSTGIGLRNIISRYKLLTAEPVLVIQTTETFTVKIPLFE